MPEPDKVILVNPERCTGCHGCEMACSMKHFGLSSPLYSRIRIQEFREVNTFVPVLCQACTDAPCIKSCPTNARLRRPSGAVVTEEERCIGCRTCIYACPFGAVMINPQSQLPMTCDLCEGDERGPWCVAACTMQGALQLVDRQHADRARSRDWAGVVKRGYSLPGDRDELDFGERGYGTSDTED